MYVPRVRYRMFSILNGKKGFFKYLKKTDQFSKQRYVREKKKMTNL